MSGEVVGVLAAHMHAPGHASPTGPTLPTDPHELVHGSSLASCLSQVGGVRRGWGRAAREGQRWREGGSMWAGKPRTNGIDTPERGYGSSAVSSPGRGLDTFRT